MTPPLRVATFLAPNMEPVYRFVADRLGQALGRPAVLETHTDFGVFARGEADIGFVCGLPYVQLARQEPSPVELLAAPVLAGERFGGRPIYVSDVIVAAGSPHRSFADLRGARWAYNDRDSQSGYNLTRAALVRMGETDGFFGEVVEAGFHQRAIRMVADGEVDAAAIDCQVLAIELRDHPELVPRLRVIDTLGPSGIQPVVAASRLPAAEKAAARAALLALADDPAARRVLAHGFVERFAPVADADYDSIRAMLADCERAGFLELR